MATDFNSFDASPLGAFTESTFGARNGNVRRAFILPAIVTGGVFVLALVELPDLIVTTTITTPGPIRRAGGWRNTIVYIDRRELVRASLDWDAQRFNIIARTNVDDIVRPNVPVLPERLVFSSSEWQIVPGIPPNNRFDLFVGPARTVGQFAVTLVQFGTYLQVQPTVGDTRLHRITYRATGRFSAGGTVNIDGVQQLFGAATNDVAPFFLKPTTAEGSQHLGVAIETWFDQDFGYIELDSGTAYVVALEGGTIVAAYRVPAGTAALRHPRPGWSTWSLAEVDGENSYARGDIAFASEARSPFLVLRDDAGNFIESSRVAIPRGTIRELLHGMIPG